MYRLAALQHRHETGYFAGPRVWPFRRIDPVQDRVAVCSSQRRAKNPAALGLLFSADCKSDGTSAVLAGAVRYEVGALDPECIEQAGDILTLCLLVVSSGSAGGEPHPAKIRGNNSMIAGKLRRERRPHIACLSIPVKQDDSGSLSADPYRQGRAIRSDVLDFEPGWKRLHISGGGHQHTFLAARNCGRQFCCLPLAILLFASICHGVPAYARYSSATQASELV